MEEIWKAGLKPYLEGIKTGALPEARSISFFDNETAKKWLVLKGWHEFDSTSGKLYKKPNQSSNFLYAVDKAVMDQMGSEVKEKEGGNGEYNSQLDIQISESQM